MCECSHLQIIRDKEGVILRLECMKCKKTWRYNSLLGYWSDSYLGKFVKVKESESNG